MARLTEEMVIARSKQSDLASIKKLNCWGAELTDVSLLRKLPNVEVLAFSVNNISSLEDFAHCSRLKELYVRKNNISDISEIRHLIELQHLHSLWLDENPCCNTPEYRLTVLRTLPNLQKLDNITVQPEEVQEAMRKGCIVESDEYYYDQREAYTNYRTSRSADSSPERRDQVEYRQVTDQCSDTSECEEYNNTNTSNGLMRRSPVQASQTNTLQYTTYIHEEQPTRPTQQYYEKSQEEQRINSATTRCNPADERTNSGIRHSQSAQSIKEYPYSNGERYSNHPTSPPAVGVGVAAAAGYNHRANNEMSQSYYERGERNDSYHHQQLQQRCPLDASTECVARAGDIPSAVMTERRGFTRRPVTRNSNLLSAVLCLVKELDYPSLEVAEMAVRCRMDELANSQ